MPVNREVNRSGWIDRARYRTMRYRQGSILPRAMFVTPAGSNLDPVSAGRQAQAGPFEFTPDGFHYAKRTDIFFDAVVRVPSIAPSSTVTQLVFQQEERIKSGWIRKVGYNFNSPHGFFQCQTFILIAGGVPSNYIFKTVDPTLPGGQYTGSLPVEQIGSIDDPADVYIVLPGNAQVEIRLVNNSLVETFSAEIRLWGWSQGG